MHNKISIIVPFYNSAKTLDRCINSILEQTYHNFELLLVDDGSVDNSCEVVQKYTIEDERVILLQKKHGGVSAARNYGLDYAEGKFVQFVDADDDIEPDMLEVMLNLILKKHADVAVCNFTHPSIKSYVGNKVFEMRKKSDMLEFYQNTFTTVVPWNKLYRRDAITNKFVEEIGFCEDEMFFIANMQNIKRIAVTDRVLYHYYVTPKDASIEECSCINKIARAKDFWKSKETYWYKRTALMPISNRFFANYLEGNDLDIFTYTRIFDFMIWEIIILGSLDVDRYGLIKEIQSIFADPRFIKSLDVKKIYGIKYVNYPEPVRNEKISAFVNQALDAYNDITEENKNLNLFFVIAGLFAKEFIVEGYEEQEIDKADFLARAFLNVLDNSTPEAAYVNGTQEKVLAI